MAEQSVKIEELTIRVPNVNTEEADALGRDVNHELTNRIGSRTLPRDLGASEIRVQVPPGISRRQMVSLITESILKGII